jgi:hypothetical protein
MDHPQYASWQADQHKAKQREWHLYNDSDPDDSDDDGLLTPISLSSQHQNLQSAQQPTPPHQPTTRNARPSTHTTRPYTCRVGKSLRLDKHSLRRPVTSPYGSDAISLHPRRKGWVTYQSFPGKQVISMTFERYVREFVSASHIRVSPLLTFFEGSDRSARSTSE